MLDLEATVVVKGMEVEMVVVAAVCWQLPSPWWWWSVACGG